MPIPENQKPESFFRRAGKKLSRALKKFRSFVEQYRWLMIFYKLTIALLGTIIILAGIAMLVLPGPGWLTIFFGFALLGTEFVWARKVILWLRKHFEAALDRWRRYRATKRNKKEDPQTD